MDISFIILTWNSEPYLERCIACINQALASSTLRYEIQVLDNGSQDRTPVLLASLVKQHPGIVFAHYEDSNTGTTRSRNRLFAAAQGSYLCVMDSDVEIKKGVIEKLLDRLEASQQLGIVVPRILYPSGAWQKSFDHFPTLLNKVNRFIRLRAIEQQEAAQFEQHTQALYIDYAISAFWLMRRELLNQVGVLDEKIFYAPEDVDFCLRVWQAGYQILYEPSVSIVHHTQEISRGFKLNRAKLSHIKGLLCYFFKHRYFFRRPRVGSRSVADFATTKGLPR